MFSIEKLGALEILDSRGRPTVQASCRLTGGFRGTASVPSGASTGTSEAFELRDGDPKRFRGLGCQRAVENVNQTLRRALAGRTFSSQEVLDRAILELDRTPNKAALGANAILAVSLAFARAAAQQRKLSLHEHFADLFGKQPKALPRPIINLFSGGMHAGGQSPLQDVLVVPVSAKSVADALVVTFEVYQCAAELMAKKYSMRLLRADEGGLAPPFKNAEAMLEDAVAAIRAAGFAPRRDVALAVDVAASQFYRRGVYLLGEQSLSSSGMIEQLARWVDQYPIVSVEDGLAEEDWEHWPKLRERLAGRALTVGDDLLCTNPTRIKRAVQLQAADALLLKVNQIGTLTEALESYRLARSAGWRVAVSARSGETEDDWLADLAVGWAGDQIKVGSITQSDRLSKYNRLLAIERETGLPIVNWPR
jgi:enolase 1/2/3